jgi:transposase-like protein
MPQEDVPKMQTTKQQRRARRGFSPQFKAEVVSMCRAGNRPIGQVAQDLDLIESSVRRRGGLGDGRPYACGVGVVTASVADDGRVTLGASGEDEG